MPLICRSGYKRHKCIKEQGERGDSLIFRVGMHRTRQPRVNRNFAIVRVFKDLKIAIKGKV